MDGYAVRAADIAACADDLRVIGEVAAGRPFSGAIKAGEAVRIFTGGVVPPGADTIVIQENTERDGRIVSASTPHCRRRHATSAAPGWISKPGDVLLARGRLLTGRDVTLAAAMNNALLPVASQAPRVAVFATGDELVHAGQRAGARPDRLFQWLCRSRRLAQSEGAEVDRSRDRSRSHRRHRRRDPPRAGRGCRRAGDDGRRLGRRL